MLLTGEAMVAYILSLESGNHPRHSLDDMAFDLELVIIRIAFLEDQLRSFFNTTAEAYMTDPSLFRRRQDFPTIRINTR
jgi:hypothetical protein